MPDPTDPLAAFAQVDADARRRYGHGIEECTRDQLKQLRADNLAGAARAIHDLDQLDAEGRERFPDEYDGGVEL